MILLKEVTDADTCARKKIEGKGRSITVAGAIGMLDEVRQTARIEVDAPVRSRKITETGRKRRGIIRVSDRTAFRGGRTSDV